MAIANGAFAERLTTSVATDARPILTAVVVVMLRESIHTTIFAKSYCLTHIAHQHRKRLTAGKCHA